MNKTSDILKFIFIVIVSIITIEVLIMFILNFLFPHYFSVLIEAVIDASALIILLLPLIYFFLYRPMQISLKKTIESKENLKKSDERYSSLIKTSIDGFMVINIDGCITEVNDAYCLMSGFQREKLLTMHINELTVNEDTTKENAKNIIKQGWDRFESKHISAEGKIIDVLISTIYISMQKIFLVFISDITQSKKHERELQLSKDKLEELNATKDKFFSIIAHDLKNPFAALLTSCELLKRSAAKQDINKMEKLSDSISNSSKDAYRLLENLLDWSRLQLGKFEVCKECFNVSSIITDAISSLQNTAALKKIEIIAPDNKNACAFFDREMFKAIIRNFTTNAIKFSHTGEKVIIEMNEFNEKEFKILVKDTGIGISKNDLCKLFRIDISHTTLGTSGEKGTGLGLCLCKDFAEKNGSELFVESEEGKGSTFGFTVEKCITI